MEPILTLENVGFRYGSRWTLKEISLDIRPGELIGILGPNGSGKSTLLRVMDGVLAPHQGRVCLNNRTLKHFRRQDLARKVALVPQESIFSFAFSVLEVVLMGRAPHLKRLQFEGAKDLEIALGALEAMQALELAQRNIHELSGGEKQRVLIARALAQEPELILLDEPTSFLDIKFKKEIFELIASLSRRQGLSVVVVSHDIDLAAHYCQRVVMLQTGRLFSAGRPDQVITTANVARVYDCPVLVDQNPATGSPRVNIMGDKTEATTLKHSDT